MTFSCGLKINSELHSSESVISFNVWDQRKKKTYSLVLFICPSTISEPFDGDTGIPISLSVSPVDERIPHSSLKHEHGERNIFKPKSEEQIGILLSGRLISKALCVP